MLPHHWPSLQLLGLVHSGLDGGGSVLIKASGLQNRFLLGTDRHTSIVGYSSRLLYEAFLLPQLFMHPHHLLYAPNGTVVRMAGLPLYDDYTFARRIEPCAMQDLLPLRFLSHSSGIATIQQMDNAMRDDVGLMSFVR